MGCFDNTFADTGENIQGANGVFCLPPEVAEMLDLYTDAERAGKTVSVPQTQLEFDGTDEYGNFYMTFMRGCDVNYMDMYALLTVFMQAHAGNIDNNTAQFIELVRNRDFGEEFEQLSRKIRSYSIAPRLESLHGRHIDGSYECTCDSPTPLVILSEPRGDLLGEDLRTVAKLIGVSTPDPNQGFELTTSLFCTYIG